MSDTFSGESVHEVPDREEGDHDESRGKAPENTVVSYMNIICKVCLMAHYPACIDSALVLGRIIPEHNSLQGFHTNNRRFEVLSTAYNTSLPYL